MITCDGEQILNHSYHPNNVASSQTVELFRQRLLVLSPRPPPVAWRLLYAASPSISATVRARTNAWSPPATVLILPCEAACVAILTLLISTSRRIRVVVDCTPDGILPSQYAVSDGRPTRFGDDPPSAVPPVPCRSEPKSARRCASRVGRRRLRRSRASSKPARDRHSSNPPTDLNHSVHYALPLTRRVPQTVRASGEMARNNESMVSCPGSIETWRFVAADAITCLRMSSCPSPTDASNHHGTLAHIHII